MNEIPNNPDSPGPDQPEGERPGMPRRCHTVADVVSLYLLQAKREVAKNSYEVKQYHLGLFVKAYGPVAVADLRPIDLHQWLNSRESLRSEHTIRGVIATIKRAFNWALEMELIDRHPFARARSRGSFPPRRQPMSDEDFQTLLRFSAPSYRRLLIFLKYTGARPCEASKMRWADIRLEEKCVVLHEHKTAKVTGKPRLIPLIPVLLKMLVWMRARRQATVVGLLERLLRTGPKKFAEVSRFMSHYGVSDRAVCRARIALGVIKERIGGIWPSGFWQYRLPEAHRPLAQPAEHDFVFMTCLGNPMNKSNLNCYLRRLRRRSGLLKGVSLYLLRHRFGFMGIKNNVPLKLLSLAMGHSDVRMTERYVNATGLTPDVLKAALQVGHGAGAHLVEAAVPVAVLNVSPPRVEEIPVTSEHVPSRYGLHRPRPNVLANVADVPMPAPGFSDPGEESVAQMMRQLMSKLSVQKRKPPHRATSSAAEVNPTHDKAYQATLWAIERNPQLAGAKDHEVFAWLQLQPDCPCRLPPTFVTFIRYVSAARLFHDTRKRVLAPRRDA